MEEENTPIYIHLKFDSHTLDVVVDVFLQMVEQRDEIDFGMYDLLPFEYFEVLIDKLKSFQSIADSNIIVSMTGREWNTYTSYIKHANDLVLDYEEGNLMADLSIKYKAINVGGLLPIDPV